MKFSENKVAESRLFATSHKKKKNYSLAVNRAWKPENSRIRIAQQLKKTIISCFTGILLNRGGEERRRSTRWEEVRVVLAVKKIPVARQVQRWVAIGIHAVLIYVRLFRPLWIPNTLQLPAHIGV